jgi:hypothetical protein
MGVGIPIALVLCFAAGFLCFRRPKKIPDQAMAAPSYPHNDYRYYTSNQYSSNFNEAPSKSPVELGHYGDSHLAHQKGPAIQAKSVDVEPVRYEM